MKNSNSVPPEHLSGPGVRFILDPQHHATLVRVDWRWAQGWDGKAAHSPAVEQDAESLRALALAMLTAELFHRNPAAMEALGTMAAGIEKGWWLLRCVNPGSNFLSALGSAYEGRSNASTPLGALLKELPGFDKLWRATRAKGGKGQDSFLTQNPDAFGFNARPPFFFRRAGFERDIINPDELFALAREIEQRAGGSWVSSFSPQAVLPTSPDPVLFPWLEYIVQICRFVPLRGVQKEDRSKIGDPQRGVDDPDERLELERVFVHLNTTNLLVEKDDEPKPMTGRLHSLDESEVKLLPVLRAVAENDSRWVVLHGGPGSGKSTFIRFLMLSLANCGLGKAKHWHPKIDGWPMTEAALIPIRIELRLFAAWLEETKTRGEDPCHLWDYFLSHADKLRLKYSWQNFFPTMEAAVRGGKVIWFLDGLDEVPTQTRKKRVRDCVEAFAASGIAKLCRIIVTCRTRAYETAFKDGTRLLLTRGRLAQSPLHVLWPAYELAGLKPVQKAWFVDAWYDGLTAFDVDVRAVANERKAALKAALDHRERPEVGEMAKTPLLLTVVTHLHSSRRELRLPDNRAELLHDLVDLFLRRWAERYKNEEMGVSETLGGLLADPGAHGLTAELFLQKIAGLAFESFKEGKAETPAVIPAATLRGLLVGLHKDLETEKGWAWADKVVQYVLHRAGLLVSQDGENFEFSHRLICEYLAAYHLVLDSSDKEICRLVSADSHWDEVIRLVSGYHVFVEERIRDAYHFIEELCGPAMSKNSQDISEVEWRRVVLAADCLKEMGPDKRRFEPIRDGRFVEKLCPLLVSLIEVGMLSPRDRARAGRMLGELGDPRLGVVPGWPVLTEKPFFVWSEMICADTQEEICAGRGFAMGGDCEGQSGKSKFLCPIQHPFRLAKYPITNAQFDLFVRSKSFKGSKRSSPMEWDTRFLTPNHPVVNVSWHYAMAFCNWLNEELDSGGVSLIQLGIPVDDPAQREQWRVALPAEVQWERAARHTDGRFLPWIHGDLGPEGEDAEIDEPLELRCNYQETGIGMTSAVGLFPKGAAPCGCLDMVGNVWEWCRTRWTENPLPYKKQFEIMDWNETLRVLRGGAWINKSDIMHGSYRYNADPGVCYDLIGFRCVLMPREALI